MVLRGVDAMLRNNLNEMPLQLAANDEVFAPILECEYHWDMLWVFFQKDVESLLFEVAI